MTYSRTSPPSAITKCPLATTPCIEAKERDDSIAIVSAEIMQLHTGNKVDASATEPQSSEGMPYMTASDISKCKAKAYQLENDGVLRRFNRYREAMPFANAAEEMNSLGDENDDAKKRKKRLKKCLTMLPETAKELNQELGLPPGTIKDKDLRNDKTGFRAAIYRSEATGKLILVARDTQPDSLVDWQTNTDNGQGRDTAQYKAMRDLTAQLKRKGVKFDIAGYSKGGGLAQEAGLISKKSIVKVFNSAGLHDASLARTGQSSFDGLATRTESFSSEGDFLTFMNEATDPKQQIINARFLRDELAGEGKGINPMNIKIRNPEQRAKVSQAQSKFLTEAGAGAGAYVGGLPGALLARHLTKNAQNEYHTNKLDPEFLEAKQAYLTDLDNMIAGAEHKQANGEAFSLFPAVHAGHKETIANSMHFGNLEGKATNPNPNFAKQVQHLMSNVTQGLEQTLEEDKNTLQDFIKACG